MINLNLEEVVSQSFIDISKKEDVKNLIFSVEENFIRQNSAQGDVDSITLQELLPKIYTKINESYPQINNFNKIFSDIKNGNLRTLYDYINNTEDVTDNVLIEYKSYLLNFITNIQKTIDSKLPLTKQVMKGGAYYFEDDLELLKTNTNKNGKMKASIFSNVFEFIPSSTQSSTPKKDILLLFESQIYDIDNIFTHFKDYFTMIYTWWVTITEKYIERLENDFKTKNTFPSEDDYIQAYKNMYDEYDLYIQSNPLQFDFEGFQSIIFKNNKEFFIVKPSLLVPNTTIHLYEKQIDIDINYLNGNNFIINNISSCFDYIVTYKPLEVQPLKLTEEMKKNKQNFDVNDSGGVINSELLSRLDKLQLQGLKEPVQEADDVPVRVKFDIQSWYNNKSQLNDKSILEFSKALYNENNYKDPVYQPATYKRMNEGDDFLKELYTKGAWFIYNEFPSLQIDSIEREDLPKNYINIVQFRNTLNKIRDNIITTAKNNVKDDVLKYSYVNLSAEYTTRIKSNTTTSLTTIREKQTALEKKVAKNDIEIIAHKEIFANIVFYILMIIIYVCLFLFINTCYNEAKANLSTVTDAVTDNILTQGISTGISTLGKKIDNVSGKNFTESISNSDIGNSVIALAKTGAKFGAMAILAKAANVDTNTLYTMFTGFFCLTVGIVTWVRPWSNSLSRNLIYDLYKNTLERVLNTAPLKEDYKKTSDALIYVSDFMRNKHIKSYNDIKVVADSIAKIDDTAIEEIAVIISAQKDFHPTLEPDPYGIRKLVNGVGSMFLNCGSKIYAKIYPPDSAPSSQAPVRQAPVRQAPVRQASTHQESLDNCTYTNDDVDLSGGKKTTRKYKTRKYKNKTKKYKNKKYKTKKYKNKKYKTRKNNTKKNKMKGGSSQDFLISETQIAIINIFKIFISPEEYPIDSISSVFDEIFQIVSKIRIPTRLINTDFLLD